MKNISVVVSFLLCFALGAQIAYAIGDDVTALSRNLKVLSKGGKITYPIQDGTVIECYAKRKSGSIDAFEEYNDYFYMKDRYLYSDTMNKLYKPEKKNFMKTVGNVKLVGKGTAIEINDPLWEWSIRHHKRTIKINIITGEYYMRGTQDNWVWFRDIVSKGYCNEYTNE